MGTPLIIVYAPGLEFAPCILQRHEPVLVQTFLSQPAIERLHCGIVRRCSRSREIDTDPPSYTHLSSILPENSEPLSVFSNCGKGRLSAMVFSISTTSVVERRFWPTQLPRHSRVDKSITVSRRSRRPSNSASETNPCPRHGSDTAPETVAVATVPIFAVGMFETQGQALLAVETVNAFMVIPSALPPEQDVNPPVTVMHARFRDLADTQAQRTVIGHHRAVTERTAADLQRKTDLPFAGPVTRLQLPDPFTQLSQRQVFFASTSCSIALSRLR